MSETKKPGKTRLSRRLTRSLSGRFPEPEHQLHTAKAAGLGKTTSEYVRDVLNESLAISDASRKVMEVHAMLTELNLLGWKSAQAGARLTPELLAAHHATAAVTAATKVDRCLALLRPTSVTERG